MEQKTYRTPNLLAANTFARTTPGKAVGFCFIPIFNFYWMFVAYKGLADDLNTILQLRRIPYTVNTGLGLACCILYIVLIPFAFSEEPVIVCIYWLISLVMIITTILFFKSAKDGAIALLTQSR